MGSVAYVYNIGKYEISRNMIEKANIEGGLNITMADMTNFGGNSEYRPATDVSWNEAARFVNWLNTSKGYQAAYNLTKSGNNNNITLWGAEQSSGGNMFRHKDAYYFLPSIDEWYKAAYGSPSGAWYNYPIGSDGPPFPITGGVSPNSAVYAQPYETGPADITNAGGLSAWSTMAQGGNVAEWNESSLDGGNDNATEERAIRGGSWSQWSQGFESTDVVSGGDPETGGNQLIGFRVAMVPEPSALSLLTVGLGGLAMIRRRRS